MGINAPTPILNLPVAIGVDGTYWVPTASTNGSPTERVNVLTLSGLQGNLDQITNVQGSIIFRGATEWDGLGPGTAGYVLSTQGPSADPQWVPNTAGSVTSVGLSLPASLFSVSGSPVTSTGTLTGDLITQTANRIFSGPTTGSAAVPTFRALVNADISGAGAALTKADDTNVTLTLGGSVSTSLVNAASLTLGWTGQLAVGRGGTGQSTLAAHGVLIGNGSSAISVTGTGTAAQVLTSNGASADPTFQDAPTALGKALTVGNDTNVTLTLGGTPATALLAASSVTAGWTGTLAATRGGTGTGTYATGDTLYASGTNALSKLSGNITATKQYLSQTGTGSVSAAPAWATIAGGDITGAALTASNDTNVTLSLGGTPTTSLLRAASITAGWTGTLAVSRGGLGAGTQTAHGVLLGQGTSAVTATSVGATGSVLAGNSAADPTFQTISAILDNIGATQGQILYRGASAWAVLNPGSSGNVLSSGGPSANPSWISVGGTGTVTSVDVSGGTTGLTTSGGPVTGSGTITLAGTLIPANGGTGLASYAIGDLLYASGTTTLSKLADVATGNVLLSGGVGVAPSWGKVDLTAAVSGILPGANGGTGNGFFAVSGPATSLKTFTFPNASATVLTSNAAVTVPQGGTGLTTITNHGVMLGQGTSNIAATSAGTAGQILKSGGASADPAFADNVASITFIIDGGGSTITTGIKGDLQIPFGCTITTWTLLADQSGSIVVDIWMDTYANYPPTIADTITGSALPTISTATKGQSSTLTGWTTAITAGNTLRFNVNSVTSIQRVTLALTVTKS